MIAEVTGTNPVKALNRILWVLSRTIIVDNLMASLIARFELPLVVLQRILLPLGWALEIYMKLFVLCGCP